MHEADVFELEILDVAYRHWRYRLGILRCLENLPEVRERDLRFPVDVDDVPQLLHRPEDEERIEQQREELADRDLLGENQIQHHEQNARAQQVDRRSLNEAQAADVFDLL